jgi:branched-subunit amino acid transport protein
VTVGPGVTVAELLVVVGMAIAVYVPKALPLVLISEGLTARLRRWLQYVAPAVLGALVAPSIVSPAGRPAGLGWDQAAYVVAFGVAIWTRRMIPSLASGMAAVILTALIQR